MRAMSRRCLRPHERGPLLYTSSSTLLQQRLGRHG
jgi:hypothetical protein